MEITDSKLSFLNTIYYWLKNTNLFLTDSQDNFFWQIFQFQFIPLALSQEKYKLQFCRQNNNLCHLHFQQNNLINAINIFLNNGYPLQFIFSSFKKRIKFFINDNRIIKFKEKFFTISYTWILYLKNSFQLLICSNGKAFSILKSLKNFIKKGKDRLDSFNVYTHW